MPEAGHLLMEERPERFAALVGEFLAEGAALTPEEKEEPKERNR